MLVVFSTDYRLRRFHGVAIGFHIVRRIHPTPGSTQRRHLGLQVHHRLSDCVPYTQRDPISRKFLLKNVQLMLSKYLNSSQKTCD